VKLCIQSFDFNILILVFFREVHISKLEALLQEKESDNQKQNLKLNQLTDELQKEITKTSNISETASNLKSNLICSENEQKKLQSE